MVEQINYWDETLIKRLRTSKDKNSQISGSFGVVENIDYIVKNRKIEVSA
ncbi:MAG: hypothetical protein IPJ26_11820 [Bacteroidetes bacterium]|nr:hypothetical protein [Bacteroidota bacterium]